MTLDRTKQLAESWRQLDWRKMETALNSVPHFMTRIEDIDLHFIHKKSSHADAIPLILCHGWPGSFHEFVHLVDAFNEPPSGQQAFHVVIPSMPGFTFSSAPLSTSWQMNDTARIYDALMQRLDYSHYLVQGGDWGSIAARLLGNLFPQRCVGVHLNFCPATPPGWGFIKGFPGLVEWAPFLPAKTKQDMQKGVKYLSENSGYRIQQGTKLTTLAFGLTDSPVGLLAWIAEKFDAWVGRPGGQQDPITDETILVSISLYWFTHSIGTSFLPYKQNRDFESYLGDYYLRVPSAHSVFPAEIVNVPAWVVNRTGNFVWRKEAAKGGHFASLEQPEIFLEHLREALPILWKAANRGTSSKL